MALEQRVYSVLVVSSNQKFNSSLSPMLPESGYDPVTYAASVSEAKQILLDRSYDFVIINTPLHDEFGSRFAIDTTADNSCVVLMLIREDVYNDVQVKVSKHGVFTLRKPMSSAMITQSLDFLCSARERLRKLQKKTMSVEEKMEEIRLVNRAKWYLIEKENFTEPQAHRFIEKQAMDRCISRREVAQQILDNT